MSGACSPIALIFFCFLVFLFFFKCLRPRNFPPGPIGLPLVGYIPFLKSYDSVAYKALLKLGSIYGPITAFYIGPKQVIVSVSGYRAVHEALNNDDLNGRPDTAARRERTFGKRLGLMFVDGDFSREQRRFTLRHLRDFGFGKTSIEPLIHEEIVDLVESILEQALSNPKNVVNFKGAFAQSTLNVLWTLVGGRRFDRGDSRLTYLLDITDFVNRSFKPFTSSLPVPKFLLRQFPALRKLMGIRNDVFGPLQDFIRETIKDHEKDRDDSHPRDFIDVYLREIQQQRIVGGNANFSEEQLISIIIDLFLGGSETTSNAIGFALIYLLHHPDVQKKMQDELDFICGDSLPSLAHRPNLVYTEAVLMESLRLANVSPLGIVHSAFKDTHLRGYFIPKGAIVLMNIYSINMEESYWGDPHVFRPERHLDEDFNLIKSDHFIPFGSGKLMCLGEPLARNTFFIFTATLIKSFEWTLIPGSSPPTLEPLIGVTNSYQGFSAVVQPRSSIN